MVLGLMNLMALRAFDAEISQKLFNFCVRLSVWRLIRKYQPVANEAISFVSAKIMFCG